LEIIQKELQKLKEPSYRYGQFLQAFYKDLITNIDEITSWPKPLREKLHDIPLQVLEPIRNLQSKQQDTIKVLMKRNDGKAIESVLMRHRDGRNTVCVSCMVGCPVGCIFCATGKMGFQGNLNADEIVEQVLYFARMVKREEQSITNVVFMGMGEPLLNLEQVEKAVEILTDPKKLGLSIRRITISTSGYIKQLKDLIDHGYKGRLALSLHAPNQKLRETIMPSARFNQLPQLMQEFDRYVEVTNRRVSYEYILIKGVNDSIKQAKELAELLKRRLAHVNLIPYNPIADSPLQTSDLMTINMFKHYLDKYGVDNTIRVTMGSDVKAACGQLAGS
jgi:23S rRNA (adenine2503-C2)-methyltransferase